MYPKQPPFIDHIGIVHSPEEDVAVAEVEIAPHLMNRSGMAHGGLIAALMDTTMGKASKWASQAKSQVTIEMKVSYMGAGRGHLRCEAECVHKTGSLTFCEAEIRDADGAMVARASATFKYRT